MGCGGSFIDAFIARGIEPEQVEKLARLAGARPLRALSANLAGQLVSHPPERLWRLLGPVLLKSQQSPGACCESGSVHHRFVQRYFDLLKKPEGLAHVWRILQAMPAERAGQILDAYLRMVVVGMLRHRLYRSAQARTRRPAAVLMELQLALFPECNLECKGCYSLQDRRGQVPGKTAILEMVDQAAACGCWAVHVVGKGEPFLSEHAADDLLEVIAERPHLMFSIATNGSYMSPGLAERLAGLGNLIVSVSVDGPEAEHDARRGSGSHRQVMRALDLMAEHHALFAFTCMVSAQNHAAVTRREFVDGLAERGCLMGVYSKYFPLASEDAPELTLTDQMRGRYSRRFARLRESTAMPLLDIEEVEEHTGCRSRAGLTVYVDGTTGRVAPCIRMPFSPAGCDLNRSSLGEILDQAFFRDYRDAPGEKGNCCGSAAELHGQALARHLAPDDAQTRRLNAYLSRCALAHGAAPGPSLGDQS